jgi:thiol-disulfide isomerase/thioredoxin
MTLDLNFPRAIVVTALLLCAGLYTNDDAQAQTSAAVGNASDAIPVITGTTLEKKTFNLAALKGKVVLVMFWSTDCAVCRDKMPELRENVQGWADKPFEMVLVSVDKRMSDVDSYNAILNKSVPLKQRFTQLWTGEAGYKDNLSGSDLQRSQLPTTLLIDKQGKLVERFNGRVPAEVWDKIADLL